MSEIVNIQRVVSNIEIRAYAGEGARFDADPFDLAGGILLQFSAGSKDDLIRIIDLMTLTLQKMGRDARSSNL